MKFGDLKTGDLLSLVNKTAVLLSIQPHPARSGFNLMVWWLLEDERLSFDCLAPGCALIPGSRVHSDGLDTWHQATRKLNQSMWTKVKG